MIIRGDDINNNEKNNSDNLTLLALASTNPAQRSMTLSASDLTTHTRGRGRTRRPLTPNLNRRKKSAFNWSNNLVSADDTEKTTTARTMKDRTNHDFKITINNRDINAIGDQNTGNVFAMRKRANSV